jgi:methionyl-tRNA formyltransferase
VSRIRTLFLGTPDIARYCLEHMIKDDHFEIVGVVTQPDRPAGRKMQLTPSPVKELVQPLGIPVFTPENINTPESMAELQALTAEVAVVVAYGQILKQAFLDLYPQKVVNVHASLLPRWRGAAPIQRALMAGDRETGVALQVVVRKMDAGPVLGIRKFALTPEMNAYDSYAKCRELGAQLLEVDLMDYLRGNLSPNPQDESQVTHAAKIEKSEAELDWNKDAEALHNQVRGLAMGPVAQTLRAGKIVKIHKTRVLNVSKPALRPGQVVEATEKSLIVSCGKGSLDLLEVQPESRAKMPIAEYLRGYPAQPGDVFGFSS